MLVTTQELSKNTKVWVYQSDRPFTQEEYEKVNAILNEFVEIWESHGKPVKGAYEIIENQFIVIFGDLSFGEVSGCSIDKSVELMRQVQALLNVNLLDKGKVAYKEQNNINVIDFKEIKALVADGVLSPDTEVFDNSVSSIEEYSKEWIKPAKDTWLKRYFK